MIYYNSRIPTVKLKIPRKNIFGILIPNFCYIQVIFFTLVIYQWQRLGLSKSATMKKLFFTFFFMAKSISLPLVDI